MVSVPGRKATVSLRKPPWTPPVRPTGLPVLQNQLSGNLLRKFKNSNGWQKLWVVFTNFCLFFYKSHQVCNPHLTPCPSGQEPCNPLGESI